MGTVENQLKRKESILCVLPRGHGLEPSPGTEFWKSGEYCGGCRVQNPNPKGQSNEWRLQATKPSVRKSQVNELLSVSPLTHMPGGQMAGWSRSISEADVCHLPSFPSTPSLESHYVALAVL